MSDAIGGIAAEKIHATVTRIEALDEEIAGLNEDKAEIFQEAKGLGLDVKVIKAFIAERRKKRKDPAGAQEQEAVLDLYRDAFEMVDERKKNGHARVQAREAAE